MLIILILVGACGSAVAWGIFECIRQRREVQRLKARVAIMDYASGESFAAVGSALRQLDGRLAHFERMYRETAQEIADFFARRGLDVNELMAQRLGSDRKRLPN